MNLSLSNRRLDSSSFLGLSIFVPHQILFLFVSKVSKNNIIIVYCEFDTIDVNCAADVVCLILIICCHYFVSTIELTLRYSQILGSISMKSFIYFVTVFKEFLINFWLISYINHFLFVWFLIKKKESYVSVHRSPMRFKKFTSFKLFILFKISIQY